MRHLLVSAFSIAAAVFLAACEDQGQADANAPLKDLNAIDEAGLSQVMLSAADPGEAVNYFRRAAAESPDRIDLQRGLAQSLVRDDKVRESLGAWEKVIAHPDAENADRVDYADALIRVSEWEKAEEILDSVPPTYETFKRYRLEAMVADSNKEWAKSDSFYQTAVGLTTRPAGVFNNWGYSKLTRGDYAGAESLFGEALKYDDSLFTAKNNLVLARGAQRKYDLPIVPMTQIERAQLLYTLALTAIKQGDVVTGESLLKQAIDTHPQHFEAAVQSLRALQSNVQN